MKVILKCLFVIFLTLTFVHLNVLSASPLTYSIEKELCIVQRPPIEQEILDEMSIEQKVGQLFMFGFLGTDINENISDLVQNKHIGGVLLLGTNISTDQQLILLNTNLQKISKIPLLISIDQEGGTVARLKGNDILTTPQKYMETTQEAYQIALQRGLILKSLGININLAPVVENITSSSSFMYQRVFRGTEQEISEKSKSAIQGYSDSNIASVAKHYPGHSNSSPDSHYSLPKVYIQENEFNQYIYPFKYLIEQNSVDVIMVGHILYPNIDSKISTVSYKLLTQKLRDELKFDGVLITDDMEMDSIERAGEYCQIAKEALLAGNDILLYSGMPTVQREVYECVLNSIKKGEISEELVNEKVKRVLKLKAKFNIVNYSTLQQLLEIQGMIPF